MIESEQRRLVLRYQPDVYEGCFFQGIKGRGAKVDIFRALGKYSMLLFLVTLVAFFTPWAEL